MPFVERDGANKITGAYNRPQPGQAEEFIAENDPEVVAFRTPRPTPKPKLPPPPTGNSIADLRADVTALRQAMIDSGQFEE